MTNIALSTTAYPLGFDDSRYANVATFQRKVRIPSTAAVIPIT